MKTITKYQCEICQRQYDSPESAEQCESRRPPVYPVGMIYNNPAPNCFYANMTFCVAKIKINNHCNDSFVWACRDNGHGDSLSHRLCVDENSPINLGTCDIPDHEHPTFKRLVAWLQEYKPQILITVWDGGRPVLLNPSPPVHTNGPTTAVALKHIDDDRPSKWGPSGRPGELE